MKIFCPYDGTEAVWVSNAEVYGKPMGKSYMIYLCRTCLARVGCHQNTRKPLGTLANLELRTWRMRAHDVIDPLWRYKEFSRTEVYAALSSYFDRYIHIGESDIELCQQIISVDWRKLLDGKC